jgi:hypothetical protein
MHTFLMCAPAAAVMAAVMAKGGAKFAVFVFAVQLTGYGVGEAHTRWMVHRESQR